MQMKLDFFFHRQGSGRNRSYRKDPEVAPLSPFSDDLESGLPFETDEAPRLALPRPCFGVRQMSPRQLAAWAHEMYLSGAFSWQEYRFAGFHAELHPDYNKTVGVLTGHRAAPDHPRDMIREWEDRLAFFCRHNEPQDPQVRRVKKVLALLNDQTGQADAKGRKAL
jgi:hypothetical protein